MTLFALTVGGLAAEAPVTRKAGDGLTMRDAVVLGVVEGITEFLPISSTGHLIITSALLGLDEDTPLTTDDGQPLWHKAPSAENPQGTPLTIKLAADTYIVVLQIGAIFAVAFLYWQHMRAILQGLLGGNPEGLRLLRNLALAFFPVVLVGLALEGWIERSLFSVPTVIAALVVGSLLMLAAERWRRQFNRSMHPERELHTLTITQALGIGGMQCLALWPGMSRSMVTMVGGYFAGLTPARAAEFSFLLGLPVLGGAAIYKAWKAGPAMVAVFGWGEMLVGALITAVSAAVAVKFLISYLSRHGLEIFAAYRLLLAIAMALWYYL